MMAIVLPESGNVWESTKKTLLTEAQESIEKTKKKYIRQKTAVIFFVLIFVFFIFSLYSLLLTGGEKTGVVCFLVSGCVSIFAVTGFNAYSEVLSVNISKGYTALANLLTKAESANSISSGEAVLCKMPTLNCYKNWKTPQIEALLFAVNSFVSLQKIKENGCLKHYYKERKVFVEYADDSGVVHSCSFPAEIEYNAQVDSDRILYTENGIVFVKKYPCDTLS